MYKMQEEVKGPSPKKGEAFKARNNVIESPEETVQREVEENLAAGKNGLQTSGRDSGARENVNIGAETLDSIKKERDALKILNTQLTEDISRLSAENKKLKEDKTSSGTSDEKDAKIAELTAKLEAKAVESGASPEAPAGEAPGASPASQPESSEPEPKTDEEAKARGQKEAELVAKEILRFKIQERNGSIKEEDKAKKAELEKKQPLLLQLADKGLAFLKENPDLLKKVTIAPAPAASGTPASPAPNPLVAEFLKEFKKPDIKTFSTEKFTVTRIEYGFSIVKKKQ